MSRSFRPALLLMAGSTCIPMVAYSAPLGNAATLNESLAAGRAGATWILSSMSVGIAVALLTAGAIGDLSGRRRTFLVGAGVFAAGSVLCAVATDPLVFVLGRLVEGLGAAGLIATSLGLAGALATDAADRAATARWWGAGLGLGIAAGPVLSGLLDLADLWRGTYLGLAVAGLLLASAAHRLFAESDPVPGRRLDVVGAVSMTVGLTLLLLTIVEARAGWSGTIALGLVGALVALAVFAVSQARGSDPMLHPDLFRRGDFTAATLAASMTGAGTIALFSFAGTFLATARGLTTLQAGLLLVAWSGTGAVTALFSQRFATRVSGTTQLAVGLAGCALGTALVFGIQEGSSALRLLPGLLVAGVATGVLNAGLGRQATSTVPPAQVAVGTAVNNTSRYLGAAVGTTVVALVASAPASDLEAQLAGWNLAVVITTLASLLGAVGVVLLGRRGGPAPDPATSSSPAPHACDTPVPEAGPGA